MPFCSLQLTVSSGLLLSREQADVKLGYLSQRTKRMCQVTLAPALMHIHTNMRKQMWTSINAAHAIPSSSHIYSCDLHMNMHKHGPAEPACISEHRLCAQSDDGRQGRQRGCQNKSRLYISSYTCI